MAITKPMMKSASISGRERPRNDQKPAVSASTAMTMMSATRSMNTVPTVREIDAP